MQIATKQNRRGAKIFQLLYHPSLEHGIQTVGCDHVFLIAIYPSTTSSAPRPRIKILLHAKLEGGNAEGAGPLPPHIETLRASASRLLLRVAFRMFIELSFALLRTELILAAVLC